MLYPAELQNHRQPFVAFFCQPRQDLQAPFAKIAPRTAGHAQAGRQKLSVQLCSGIRSLARSGKPLCDKGAQAPAHLAVPGSGHAPGRLSAPSQRARGK